MYNHLLYFIVVSRVTMAASAVAATVAKQESAVQEVDLSPWLEKFARGNRLSISSPARRKNLQAAQAILSFERLSPVALPRLKKRLLSLPAFPA